MDGGDVPALVNEIEKQVDDLRMQFSVFMYSDLDITMKNVVACQVVQLFEEINIYKMEVLEKYKIIKNKSQDIVPEEKPDESGLEVDDIV